MARRKKQTIPFKTESAIYTPQQIDDVLMMSVNNDMVVTSRGGKKHEKKVQYFNVPCSFDIETTSFYVDDEGDCIDYQTLQDRQTIDSSYTAVKRATMYVWQFGINGNVIVGRTWNEFVTMMKRVSDVLQLNEHLRLMVFVHNLAYEFQFMRKWFSWFKTFNLKSRTPAYAITDDWIEFRCSYILSGYSLDGLSKQLLHYPVKKMVGDLDYSLLRHSQTPLTDKEIGYCVNDVRVVMSYIQEKIEQEGGVHKFNITKTGYVRKYCQNKCRYLDGKHVKDGNYTRLMDSLELNDLTEYEMLKRAFQGGFTHANAYHSGDIMRDVSSFDFTSSYPYVMVSEHYPMSKGERVVVNECIDSLDDLNILLDIDVNKYLLVMDIVLIDVLPLITCDNPLSASKCRDMVDVSENNGRVQSARKLATTVTCVDFKVLQKFYSWKACLVSSVVFYRKAPLPSKLVKCILELYQKKTELKGVKGKEVEYLKSKEMINSVYGMTVTDFMRDEYVYEGDEWQTFELDDCEALATLYDYNDKENRFLFYPWGVFITAYARRNLLTTIAELHDDYVYSDTDSVKFTNLEKHKHLFDDYNSYVEMRLKRVCDYHKLDYSLVSPTTIDGEVKTLGVWDYEGTYNHFKTLGAKRYMVHSGNKPAISVKGVEFPVSLTVSGINKFAAIPYLYETTEGDIMKVFNLFSDGLTIPAKHSGKKTHTYVDDEIHGKMRDYLGNVAEYHEKSFMHLEPAPYEMSLSKAYANYLNNIKDVEM